MPFDAITSRPYMRLSTADLAALVDGPAPDLAAVAAELVHRDRKPARLLAARVAVLMAGASVQSAADAAMPAPIVVECVRGEVVPEMREEVVSVERVTATDAAPAPVAPPAKPARKPKAAKAPPLPRAPLVASKGDHIKLIRANARMRKAAEKQAPQLVWPTLLFEVFGNPARAARIEALKAEGWQHAATDAGGYMVFQRGEARLRIGHHGAIYLGDATWVHIDRAERDRLTDAGRPILETMARRGAAEMRIKAAKAQRKAVVGAMPKARADAKIPAFAFRLASLKATIGPAWRTLQLARRELAAA